MAPDRLLALQEELMSAVARTSIDAHANISYDTTNTIETREAVTERMAAIDPGLVYNRHHDA